MKGIQFCLLASLFFLFKGLSLLGQQSSPTLKLSGERQEWEWHVSVFCQLNPITTVSKGSRIESVLLDGNHSRENMEGVKGADLYKGVHLYSLPFTLDCEVESLRIPVLYHFSLIPHSATRNPALAAFFVDIVDAESDSLLLRLFSPLLDVREGETCDSTYSGVVILSSGNSPMEIDNSVPNALADLYGKEVRVRATVIIDPVIAMSGYRLEEGPTEKSEDVEIAKFLK